MALHLSCILFYLTIILVQSPSISSQNSSSKFSAGLSIVANSKSTSFLSPSGDFAFGFHPLPNNTNLFLLSIWYAKIPDTIVWYANDCNPVSQGSKVTIITDEGLVLTDPRGNRVWNTTRGLSGGAVSYGFMRDTGNFVLKSSGIDAPLWESFDHPTDTLLPTQMLATVTDESQVNCRFSETDFRKGRFQLRLLGDGNLVLNSRDVATGYTYGAYYRSDTYDTNSPTVEQKLVYNSSGDMYILKKNGSKFDLIQSGKLKSSEDYYQRMTLNFNGVLTWYYSPKGDTGSGWSEIQSFPDNICLRIATYDGDQLDSGACGFNSVCSINQNNKPVCNCPPHYSPLDPNDTIGSCVPDFAVDTCDKSEHKLIALQNTNWPFGDYARLNPSNEEDCKTSCLNDCFCAAAVYGAPSCWKKKLPLSNGRQDPGEGGTTWLKVGFGDGYRNNDTFNPRKLQRSAVTTGLLGGSVGVNFILLTAVVLGIFCNRHRKQYPRESIFEYDTVHRFTYKKLESATNGFREEIGRGSFGVVYKGTITDRGNPTSIAVKRLDRTFMGADKEFTAEVNAIGVTHHKNLVRFIGYCKEEENRVLVYECMSNGTVADYLFGDLRPSWLSRINIAHGIANGLLYLHEECTSQIIHCDIKPQNILVDDFHNPRISDFGLAKLLVLNQNQTNTAIRGTKGYVAPEWFKNKPVSVKVDVYSFGVLLLEIVCCRRNVCIELSADERAILTDWAFDCYQSGMLDSLVNDDVEALNDRDRLERFVKVALWCILEDPDLRPNMKTVTLMLEGVVEVPSPPCPTSFYTATRA